MMCSVKHIAFQLLVLTNCVVFGKIPVGPPFFDTPPGAYTERLSLRDCATRFYSNVGEFNGPYGGLGGVRAYRGEFQHMAAIGWTRSNKSVGYLCGGSLITRDFVLTAAHCVVDSENNPPDTVRVGDTDLGSTEDDEFAQQIAIERFITHPKYRGSRSYFDIALIKLQHQVKLSVAVCNACLWREEDVPRERMDAIGFGATGFAEALSPTLQRVQLDAIALSNCTERIAINRRQMPDGFRKDQFCAASSTMDTCEGDSGGPIGVKRVDIGGAVIPLVVGVVSFGTPCAVGSTGVYSKVSEFMDWIEQETNKSFEYIECTRSSFCFGRVRTQIPISYGDNYANNRFGLLWDDAETSSLYDCGATLIDDQYLLTLASCVTSTKGHPKYIASEKRELAAIADVYVSPRYNAGRPENNLALIKIAKFVNTNMFRPACLWNRNIDGAWKNNLMFSAYGPVDTYEQDVKYRNKTIFVEVKNGRKCVVGKLSDSKDVVCYTNNVNLVPRVCMMDHGAPVVNGTLWGEPVFAYGLVAPLGGDCGSDLYMNDVTPHIDWIESIIIGKRNQYLIFSD